MKVEKIMTRDVATCRSNETLCEAARIMWERDCGFVPVTEEDGSGRVAGILTDRDVCMAAYTRGQRLGEIRAADVMARAVQACRASDDLTAAEALMRSAQVHRLPVVDGDDRLVGVISLADVAREAARAKGTRSAGVTADRVGETLAAICKAREPRTATRTAGSRAARVRSRARPGAPIRPP